MVLPLVKQYGISMIKKEGTLVSLHLIHTFGDFMDYLPAIDYYNVSPSKRGVWLEHLDKGEEFPFDNPLVTNNSHEVVEFISAARKWAELKVESK